MADVIQDVYAGVTVHDFTGAPVTGVNRLVTQFEITSGLPDVIQDVYADGVATEIQDVYA